MFCLFKARRSKEIEISSYWIYSYVLATKRESTKSAHILSVHTVYSRMWPKPQRVSVCVQQSILTHTSHTRLLLFPAATIQKGFVIDSFTVSLHSTKAKQIDCQYLFMVVSKFAPSQWETPLLCNDVSHWLGANLESALSFEKRQEFQQTCDI